MHYTIKIFKPLKNLVTTGFILAILSTGALAANTHTKTIKQAEKPGAIVVTIKPLYSLVTHLTAGINKPVLLMKQMLSPHQYNMRPSERRLLAKAEMIIWIGPQMETSLTKVIEQQERSAATTIVSAMRAKNLKLLNKRKQHSHHREKHNPASSREKSQMIDPHIWLSTFNAIAISKHITEQLIVHYPNNSRQYNNNLDKLLGKIKQTRDFIKTNLKANRQPFIVYHDAFQYFENENMLNYIDTVNFSDETGPSLRHIREIKALINKNNIQCLLYQAPKPAVINSLIQQTAIKATALDPLGMNTNNDKNAWFELMQQLTLNISRCLTSSSNIHS